MIVKVISFCFFLSVASAYRSLWNPTEKSVITECNSANQVCYCRPRESEDTVLPVPHDDVDFNQYETKNSPHSTHVASYIKYLDKLTKTQTCFDAYVVNKLVEEALLHVKQTPNNLDLILAVTEYNRKKYNPNNGIDNKDQHRPRETEEDTSSQELTPTPEQPIVLVLNNYILNNDAQNRGSVEYILKVLQQNEFKINPQIYNLLVNLLNTQKKGSINRLNDILLLLLNNKPEVFSDKLTKLILWLLLPTDNTPLNPKVGDLILYLLDASKDNNFDENQLDVLIYLLQPNEDGFPHPEILDALISILYNYDTSGLDKDTLNLVLLVLKFRFFTNLDVHELNTSDILHGIEILSPAEVEILLKILTSTEIGPETNRINENVLKLLARIQYVTSDHLKQILTFLLSNLYRDLDVASVLVDSLFIDVSLTQNLLILLQKNKGLLHSVYFGTIINLYNNDLLDHQLLSVLVELLNQENMGSVNENQVQVLIELLERYKVYNAPLLTEIINRVKYAPVYHDNENPNKYPYNPPENGEPENSDQNLLSTEDDSPSDYENILKQLLFWLNNSSLQNNAIISDEVIQYLMKLVDVNDAGVVELTYLLKNQKPFVYNPLYYVKYRIALPAFVSNVKYLFAKNPQLAADPVELLKEIVTFGNLTEISPGLTAYPQDEIKKQTHQDGNLIQAKVLDYNAMNENDEIALVHKLSTDNVSPVDLLHLNELKGLNIGKKTIDLIPYIKKSSSDQKITPTSSNVLANEEKYYYPQTDISSNQYSLQQDNFNSLYLVDQNAQELPEPYQVQNSYLDFDFAKKKKV